MVKFIIVRHGQSTANSEGRFAGHINIELTPTGLLQAEKVSDYIIKNIKPDAIYSSDLIRAYNTVKKVGEVLNLPVNKDERLRELFGGEWENLLKTELETKYPEDFRLWKENIGLSRLEGGETFEDAQHRAVEFFTETAKKQDGKTVLIGTHACFIRIFECFIRNIPLKDMKNVMWVDNASISIVNYENGRFYPEFFNFTNHLGNTVERTTL